MRYALIYGSIAGAISISVIVASMLLDTLSHQQSQWFGYLVMVAALTLLFVGVKRYRDVECGGVISFGKAFVVGLVIAVMAGVVYSLLFEAFLAVRGGDFLTEYTASILTDMRAAGASEAEIAAQEAGMAPFLEFAARNPALRPGMWFLEIFPVGLLVALVSAAVLRNPRVLPARAA
jgi:hypothetical protein